MTSANFTMTAGNDKKINIDVKNTDGSVTSLVGCSITWVLLDQAGVEVARKTIGHGLTVTDAEQGLYSIQLDSADTTALAAGAYDHEDLITDFYGKRLTSIRGQIIIEGKGI